VCAEKILIIAKGISPCLRLRPALTSAQRECGVRLRGRSGSPSFTTMITEFTIPIITCPFIKMPRTLRRKTAFMNLFCLDSLIAAAVISISFLTLTVGANRAYGTEILAAKKLERPSSVTVISSDHRSDPRTFSIVLICDTDDTRAQGLQGFRQLRTGEAALFVFREPEFVTFWMGSVAYPIDIAFIGPDKKAVRVFPNCKPGSRELYPSGERVVWVIETAAGSGIKVGDGVRIEGAR
jgi:uncharacterized membrane protein (UPF0127 family)